MSRLSDIWPDLREAVFKRHPEWVHELDALYGQPAGQVADWLDKRFPRAFGATWRNVTIMETVDQLNLLYPVVTLVPKKTKPAFKRPATNVSQREALAMIRRLTGRR